jgi:hypothetical protein
VRTMPAPQRTASLRPPSCKNRSTTATAAARSIAQALSIRNGSPP